MKKDVQSREVPLFWTSAFACNDQIGVIRKP